MRKGMVLNSVAAPALTTPYHPALASERAIRKIGWGGEHGRAGHPGHCQSDEFAAE